MIRIALYDSNSVVLAGLVSILERSSNLEIVGSFVDEASLIALSDRPFDILLLERIPDQDFWWLEQWMLAAGREIAGILLTDEITLEDLDEYVSWGFKAFLPRLSNGDEVIVAIDAVMVGLIAIHPELAFFGESHPAITPLPQLRVALTPREIEVLNLLGTGLDNQAIATALQISKHTVKFHISSILSKLNVSSRTEAVTLGLRQGLIRL